MRRPPPKWLAPIEAQEHQAVNSSAVISGRVDAKYARSCDEWRDTNPDLNGKWYCEAIKNYKSAAASFWEAYDDEDDADIYKALWAAAKAATARAAEMEGSSSSDEDHRPACVYAAWRPPQQVAVSYYCAQPWPWQTHYHWCPLHGFRR